ncbi:hypothetical protein EXS73_03345 [Candidatus Pacearchaeota archaeon]|nr:hypothetical protein [Candidatus Pacearchaeota archaeon]
MSAHLQHYEPGISADEIAALVHDHERTADSRVHALWSTHLRKTPACAHVTWKSLPGTTMYDHVTSSLRMGARLYLSSFRRAPLFEEATIPLEYARISLASLFAYEHLVRAQPEAALLELRRGELGIIGHTDVFHHLMSKPRSTMPEYVSLIHQKYQGK